MFALERLEVYDRALAGAAHLVQLSARWDKRHTVVDQRLRAAAWPSWSGWLDCQGNSLNTSDLD